mgnify:CR=1 FL=1
MSRRKKQRREPRYFTPVNAPNVPFHYREAYKSLRTNVKFIAATEKAGSFVITSALQMESKSNISANLAITLAEEGKRVALLDCDFRKPTIHRFAQLHLNGCGITDVLMGACELRDALYHIESWNVDVLPVGTVPPNPAELLSTTLMGAVLRALRESYDYVIIDTPPINTVAYAQIISTYVDGVVLVAKSGATTSDELNAAVDAVRRAGGNLCGAVLNDVNIKSVKYSYKYKDGNKYGYKYTYADPYETR